MTAAYQQYPPAGNLALGDFTTAWRAIIDDGAGDEGAVTIAVLGEKISGLSSAEWTQLQNIDSSTISVAQWGYLGALDQGLSTTSNVQFSRISIGNSNASLAINLIPGQTIGYDAPVYHQSGNAGNIYFGINDGNSLCGVLISNTHDGTYSSQSVSIYTSHGGVVGATKCFEADIDQNVSIGKASLATTATDGFAYIPSCAGTPTGTPTAKTGYAPLVIDSTNNKLYAYIGGAWQVMN